MFYGDCASIPCLCYNSVSAGLQTVSVCGKLFYCRGIVNSKLKASHLYTVDKPIADSIMRESNGENK